MDPDLEQLLDRAQRLMAIARRLADENASLRGQLEEAVKARQDLQGRMDEARARVETALARLPLDLSVEE